MDPFSAVGAAQEIAGICLTIVKAVRSIIEAIKGAKQAMMKMISRLERMRLILNEFRSLAQRLTTSPHRNITLAFDDSGCRETLRAFDAFVCIVAKEASVHRYWMQVNWIRHEKEAAVLLSRLSEHETDLGTVLQFIGAMSGVATEHELQLMRDKAETNTVLESPFAVRRDGTSAQDGVQSSKYTTAGATSLGQDPFQSKTSDSLYDVQKDMASDAAARPTTLSQWLLCTNTDAYNDDFYLKERAGLADAAWMGDWPVVLSIIEQAADSFGEQWTNVPRLKPLKEIGYQSMWAPLHQAAYMGAPVHVIKRLLALGASRTNRTRTTDQYLDYDDLTAYDIAENLGFTEMLDVLAPRSKHNLPPMVTLSLQSQMHSLLQQILGGFMYTCSIRLPDLSVLMELDKPLLDLVLPRNLGLGVISIFLDGRELLVRHCKDDPSQEDLYRVQRTGWKPVQDVLSLGH